jgi:glucose-1-phosphate thymidylyltransferase
VAVKRGIILAGGSGNRIFPLSQLLSKQLLPVYDKPMIYYPLSTLMLAGIRDILLISTARDLPFYEQLLGDGAQLGIHISYAVQEKPEGIAQAFLIGESFVRNEPACLILGDNIFYGRSNFDEALRKFSEGALVFGYRVHDPERYGVLAFDEEGNVTDVVEKSPDPPSSFAVVGFYVYDGTVVDRARNLAPSARGELEITDLNRLYLADGKLEVEKLGRGIAWLDTGTPKSLHEAASFLATVEERQGLKLACIEEVAFNMGYIDEERLYRLAAAMPECPYRNYVVNLLTEAGSGLVEASTPLGRGAHSGAARGHPASPRSAPAHGARHKRK